MGILSYSYNFAAFVVKGFLSKSTQDFYDRCAENYDTSSALQKRYAKHITYRLPYSKTSTIGLDIACGTGISTVELNKICKEVYGVDFSSGMLSVAKKRIDKNLVKGNFLELPFPDNSMDLLCCVGAVRHVPVGKEKQFFSEIERVLKPNGHIGFCIENYSPIIRKASFVYDKFMKFKGLDERMDIYNYEKVHNLLSDAGLEVIKKKKVRDCLIDLVTSPTIIVARKSRNL